MGCLESKNIESGKPKVAVEPHGHELKKPETGGQPTRTAEKVEPLPIEKESFVQKLIQEPAPQLVIVPETKVEPEKGYRKVELNYFDALGRAEMIRLALRYNKVEFDDVRLSQAEWGAIKDQSPFGKLPNLRWGGEIYAQSKSILRFVCQTHGNYPLDPDTIHQCEALCDSIDDVAAQGRGYVFLPDGEERQTKEKLFLEEALPNALQKLNDVVVSNAESKEHLIGNFVTMADFVVLAFLSSFVYEANKVEQNGSLMTPHFALANYWNVRSSDFGDYFQTRKPSPI